MEGFQGTSRLGKQEMSHCQDDIPGQKKRCNRFGYCIDLTSGSSSSLREGEGKGGHNNVSQNGVHLNTAYESTGQNHIWI